MQTMQASLLGLLLSAGNAHGAWISDLPRGAVVVETAAVQSRHHGPRLLVLWILDPVEETTETIPEDYTCQDQTQGSRFYRGRVSVSLVNVSTDRVVNTVALHESDADEPMTLPLRIQRGLYWVAEPAGEGVPTIMRLRDYNGDGRPLEFVLHSFETCSYMPSTLVGYSERRDRVIWYEVDLTVEDEGDRSHRTAHWLYGLFTPTSKPRSQWRYANRFPEEPPRLYRFDIRYDRKAERYRGSEVIRTLSR